jgi:hypothetical protein
MIGLILRLPPGVSGGLEHDRLAHLKFNELIQVYCARISCQGSLSRFLILLRSKNSEQLFRFSYLSEMIRIYAMLKERRIDIN